MQVLSKEVPDNMQFYFIRHGQSVNNLLWDQTGTNKGRSIDAELSPIGQRQAEILAQFLSRTDPALVVNEHDNHNLAGFGITHLYTSLMVRAVATATIIADALSLPLVAWEDLHETGGIYVEDEQTGECIGQPGKNRAYFEANYPRLVLPDTLGEAGWWNHPFEEPGQRPIRAQRFLSDLMARHGRTDDRVAVVSHGAFYNYLLAALLKMPQKDGYWFHLNNAAITRIDFRDGEIGVVYMNRVDFLPKELVT
jgi:2,3-bisphosphoglycerate-dependent phosphoglycerate mutase